LAKGSDEAAGLFLPRWPAWRGRTGASCVGLARPARFASRDGSGPRRPRPSTAAAWRRRLAGGVGIGTTMMGGGGAAPRRRRGDHGAVGLTGWGRRRSGGWR
jgi:hypothetical protein